MKNILLLFFAFILAGSLAAQTPQAFKYQAVARDNVGNTIANQSIGFRISILPNSPSGTAVYAETHTIASNDFGLVNMEIGTGSIVSGVFSAINWGAASYFVKIEMDIAGGSNYLLMGTSQLLSVPYALHAETANNVANDQVNDADADPLNEIQTISKTGNTVTLSNGGGSFADDNTIYTAGTGISIVGTTINNTAAGQTLSLTGTGATTISGAYPAFTINSIDNVNDADADPSNELQTLTLVGNTLSITNGNAVTLSTGGGSLDQAYDFGGAGLGRTITVDNGPVQLSINGANAIGLRADLSNTGTGIIATSTTAGNTFSAMQATTNSSSAAASAIIGSSSGAAWGVAGQVLNGSTAQAAVYGSNLRTNGGHGVYGIGYNGVVGQTSYSQGNAGYFENLDAIAPLGNGIGTAGKGYYGVVGEDRYLGGAAGAYGVLANGNMGATGTKTFIIDHPKDPENKTLRHFSVESNEVLNIYRGTAAFDANGEVRIDLPDYFADINRNPNYQLTPIGGPGQLYIKQKIENNQFVIAGGQAGMEVSWTVTAERNDAYLQQNPEQREVEVEKRADQKGKYFMPYLYNQPAEKGILYQPSTTKQVELKIKD
jgi:hypothetical protein